MEWRVDKLRELFLDHEVAAILQTPIAEHGLTDRRWWKPESTGIFSVRSAYKLQRDYSATDEGPSECEGRWWQRHVWGTTISPTAKMFLWRAFKNYIPTAGNLQRQHVPTDGICTLCRNRYASTAHTLIFCPQIVTTWKTGPYWKIMKQGRSEELIATAGAVRTVLGADQYDVWCIMLWCLWRSICGWLHNDKASLLLPTYEGCVTMREVHSQARSQLATRLHAGLPKGEEKWKRPEQGTYRVDVDAHFDQIASSFGVGIIIRDWTGKILAAKSKRTPSRTNVMIAEMMAVVEGITFGLEQQLAPVEIFTDSILTVKLMAEQPDDMKEFLPDEIVDIVRTARANFLVGISHMCRCANRAAHQIAHLVASGLDHTIYMDKRFPSMANANC